jgi:hypothetical protein
MKSLNTILLALGALAGTTALHAQTAAVANIPFDFTVATASLPAGEYTVKCASSTCSVIRIVNHEKGLSAMVMIRFQNPPKGDNGTSKLTFHRYGDQYYFAGVWTSGRLSGDVAPSRLERELRASNGLTQLASVNILLNASR